MKVKVLVESIIIPKADQDCLLELEPGATAADAVKELMDRGLTGSLSAREVLDTHMLICNSNHIKPEDSLQDGDTLMLIKTLLGG